MMIREKMLEFSSTVLSAPSPYPVLSTEPYGYKPFKSAIHGKGDARPTVTFPAAEHHRPLVGIISYCLVTGYKGVNNLPIAITQPCPNWESNL